MKAYVLGLIVVVSASAVLVGQPSTPKDATQELDKKVKAIQDQIDDLKKQQEALAKEKADLLAKKAEALRTEAEKKRKELEAKRAREAAAKKDHFVKMEIRGTLVKNPNQGVGQWQVVINELTWTLDFSGKKELLAEAEKLASEGVVITGKVVTKRSPLNPYMVPGQVWPMPPQPGSGKPQLPRWPNDRWDPYYPFVVDQTVIVQVESIVLAKE